MRAVIVCLLLLAGAAPAAAQSPFQPLPPPAVQTDTTTTAQATTTSPSGGGLSTGAQVLVFLGAGGLLALIAWVILRDARTHAPVRGRVGASGERKTVAPRELKQQRDRAKAKRARRARKKNR